MMEGDNAGGAFAMCCQYKRRTILIETRCAFLTLAVDAITQ